MEEVWRDVLWCCPAGYYQVSSLGNVRSLDRVILCKNGVAKKRKGQMLVPRKCGDYNAVQICGDNQYIHLLVARAFPEICGEWFDGCQVDHLDTNKLNNVASNLRVCTEKENHNNPLTRKHISESQIGNTPWNKGKPGCFSEESRRKMSDSQKRKSLYENNPNAKPILQYSVNGEFIKEWACAKSAIEYYNLNQPSLSRHLHGRTKTCGGYIWKFVTK
jgi:hypothetical protein